MRRIYRECWNLTQRKKGHEHYSEGLASGIGQLQEGRSVSAGLRYSPHLNRITVVFTQLHFSQCWSGSTGSFRGKSHADAHRAGILKLVGYAIDHRQLFLAVWTELFGYLLALPDNRKGLVALPIVGLHLVERFLVSVPTLPTEAPAVTDPTEAA